MLNDALFKSAYDKLINTPCGQSTLISLKEEFREQINSNRRYDNITSLEELLKVLKKRDYCNSTDLVCMKTISQKLNRQDVIDILNGNPPTREPSRTHVQEKVLPAAASTAKDRAYDLICTEIGTSWKVFARGLDVCEGNIDKLDRRYKTSSEKVKEVLDYHESNCDRATWRSNLLEALGAARRNDLRKRVQHIFDTHSR